MVTLNAEIVKTIHKKEVISFLRKHVSALRWEATPPRYGSGNETYVAESDGYTCFIKLGAQTERYQVMASLGLSARVLCSGNLEDGTTIMVQERIDGRHPSRGDFQQYGRKFTECIRKTHQCEPLKSLLPERDSSLFRDAGLETLANVEQKWEKYKDKVPEAADFVNEKIRYLKDQVSHFRGSGLAASHNDPCNGNWLISDDERIYLLDYESMSLDDPALDVGAILWWYYPPVMRDEFIELCGYRNDEDFRERMRIRMAVHNLNMILPRQNSFDRFQAENFEENLVDFRAVMDGKENPQGYQD